VLPIRIRRFSPDDLRSVCSIEDQCFGIDRWPRECFLWYANASPGLFLVAVRGAQIVGYSIAMVRCGRASIDSIAVRSAVRQSGVGSALLRETIRRLRRRRTQNVTLMVRRNNDAAIRLYRRFGFRRVATIARYYEDGAAGWRMSLRLTPAVLL
jgi:ribosomal-protein-alanine acetyltransferase